MYRRYIASKIFVLLPSRFPASFFSRMGLFIAVTLYAWLAVYFLEYLRARKMPAAEPNNRDAEVYRC